MTTIGQIAQSYQHMLAVANGQRQVTVTDQPARYQAYSGRNLQDFINYNSQMFTNLDGAYEQGATVAVPTGRRVLSMVNGVTGGEYTNANDAKRDFQLLQQAAQRPPFNGNVEMYMQAVIAAARNPEVASQPFTLNSLTTASVFTGPTGEAGPAQLQTGQGNPADTSNDPAEVAAPPPVPAALNTALTNFLTGSATAEEINALQTANGKTATGRLDREGNLPNATYHGTDTLVATRAALGGPLSPTNHPELYTLARARYYEITGLPADRVATPTEIAESQARISRMTPAQIAEYQSVAYLLDKNQTPLSAQAGNRINVDGLAGDRTMTSIAAVGANVLPTVPAANADANADANANTNTDDADPVKPTIILNIRDNNVEDQAFFRGFVPRLEDRYNVVVAVGEREFEQQAAGLRAAGTPFTTFEMRESNHTDAPIEAERLRARSDLGETGRFRMEFDANVNDAEDITNRLAVLERNVGAHYVHNLASGQAPIGRGDPLEVNMEEIRRVDTALTARAAQLQPQL